MAPLGVGRDATTSTAFSDKTIRGLVAVRASSCPNHSRSTASDDWSSEDHQMAHVEPLLAGPNPGTRTRPPSRGCDGSTLSTVRNPIRTGDHPPPRAGRPRRRPPGHDVRHTSQAWALHLVTPLVESPLTWGTPVSVMYVSTPRHQDSHARHAQSSWRFGWSQGCVAPRRVSSCKRLANAGGPFAGCPDSSVSP